MVHRELLSDLTDWLEDISSQWWFLLVIFGIALLDSVIPIVPSETTVILGGVAAGAGDQNLALVILAGALGAFCGDNMAYTIGRWWAPWFNRRAEQREKTRRRLDWARRADPRSRRAAADHGPVRARRPHGAHAHLAGSPRQPRAWFAAWIAIAAVIWATYAAVLGAVFGRTFEDNHTLAFVLAFGAALGSR